MRSNGGSKGDSVRERNSRGAPGRREGNLPPRATLSLPLRTSATQARRSDSGGGVKKSEKEKTA